MTHISYLMLHAALKSTETAVETSTQGKANSDILTEVPVFLVDVHHVSKKYTTF